MKGARFDTEPARAAPRLMRQDDTLYTRNAVPGTAVYGERLVSIDGIEYRRWSPLRSKLAALILLGHREVPLEADSRVLYLGAASGTTASHMSEICAGGILYCVEVSKRSFRDLVRLCESRLNMIPILGDASRPDDYDPIVERADIVYQDIAQRLQVNIFLRNLRHFHAHAGILMLKSRSMNVSKDPQRVFAEVKAKLSAEGVQVNDVVDLSPYSKDHAAFIVEV